MIRFLLWRILPGIGILFLLLAVYFYNKFARDKAKMEESRRNIDVFRKQGSITEMNGAQRYYNAVVRDYNARCETFPSAIFAVLFRFQKAEYLSMGTGQNAPDNPPDNPPDMHRGAPPPTSNS